MSKTRSRRRGATRLTAAEAKAKVLVDRKALACTKIAELMLPNGNGEAIENQAFELMDVHPTTLAGMYRRLSFSRKAAKIAAQKRKRKASDTGGEGQLPTEDEGDFGPNIGDNFNDKGASRRSRQSHDADLGAIYSMDSIADEELDEILEEDGGDMGGEDMGGDFGGEEDLGDEGLGGEEDLGDDLGEEEMASSDVFADDDGDMDDLGGEEDLGDENLGGEDEIDLGGEDDEMEDMGEEASSDMDDLYASQPRRSSKQRQPRRKAASRSGVQRLGRAKRASRRSGGVSDLEACWEAAGLGAPDVSATFQD